MEMPFERDWNCGLVFSFPRALDMTATVFACLSCFSTWVATGAQAKLKVTSVSYNAVIAALYQEEQYVSRVHLVDVVHLADAKNVFVVVSLVVLCCIVIAVVDDDAAAGGC